MENLEAAHVYNGFPRKGGPWGPHALRLERLASWQFERDYCISGVNLEFTEEAKD